MGGCIFIEIVWAIGTGECLWYYVIKIVCTIELNAFQVTVIRGPNRQSIAILPVYRKLFIDDRNIGYCCPGRCYIQSIRYCSTSVGYPGYPLWTNTTPICVNSIIDYLSSTFSGGKMAKVDSCTWYILLRVYISIFAIRQGIRSMVFSGLSVIQVIPHEQIQQQRDRSITLS